MNPTSPPSGPIPDPEGWLTRCAWCGITIPGDAPAFTIALQLNPLTFGEFDAGSVQHMLLYRASRTVPIILVTPDSETKRTGKDGLFQLCSEPCALHLKTALQEELRGEDPPGSA